MKSTMVVCALLLILASCSRNIDRVNMTRDDSGAVVHIDIIGEDGRVWTLTSCDVVDWVRLKPVGEPAQTYYGRTMSRDATAATLRAGADRPEPISLPE